MKNTLLATCLALSAPFVASGSLAAQEPTLEFPQASPASLVQDHFGLTEVEIAYSRPSVKGRKVFGGLVPYDAIWRTGANQATRISFSTDVTVAGQALPAGTYALFTIPGASEWTIIFGKNEGQWGSYAYAEKNDALRVKVKPTALQDMVESLTIGLGDLRDNSASLVIAWEKTKVAVPLKADLVATLMPKIEAVMASSSDKKPYFQAAMFYYENDLDMAKAKDWIEAASLEQPDAMWIIYRKGLILRKAGDKEGAMQAAKQSLEIAKKTPGELGAEYTRLNEALIASLK